MNQLADAFDEAGITPDMVTKLRHPSLLAQVKQLILGTISVVQVCLKLALDKAFNPAELFGKGWTIWRGPADGSNPEGEECCVPEPDVVDFEQIVTETHLQDSDNGSVHGEEKMRRARVGKNRQLGGKSLAALWSNWLYLFFGGGEWDCYCGWLINHWNAGSPSVALASVENQPSDI